MSKDYSKLADQIIDLIGGEDNAHSLYHCVTRLRFKLKDEEIAKENKSEIESLPGVLSVVEANNQFQIVIGNDVEDAYDAIDSKYRITNPVDSDTDSEESNEGNIILRFFNTLSSIFNPIIMPLAGAGMIKALLVILTTYNIMDAESSTYLILSAAGNSVFYFLPLFLAVSAARVFKVNPFISLAIVAALMEPNFTDMIVDTGTTVSFFGIPTVLMSYTGTVIPAIISIYIYSYVEKGLKRIIPKSLEIFLLPMLALLIMIPLTVIAIGPIGVAMGNGLGNAINFISVRSGVIAGLIIGGFWTMLVMVGIHWGVVPIMVNNLATYGYDVIRPLVAAATFASAGAALGVFLRARQKETKSLALSSMVPALLGGITEPIVYGLSIKYKKPLIAQIIGGAVGGAFMGAMQTQAIVYVFPALTTLPAFFGETFTYYLIGITISFVLTAVLTYIFGIDEAQNEVETVGSDDKEKENLGSETFIFQPFIGTAIDLLEVNDEVFSSGAMGDGIAIKPKDGTLYSPITGEVTTVFPTKHALGFKSSSGVEVLVHIGIDTVELEGNGFNLSVKQGDKVKRGQSIGEVNLKLLEDEDYETTTMTVVTNSNDIDNYLFDDK